MTDSNSWDQTKKHVSGSGSQFPEEPKEQGRNLGKGQGGEGQSVANAIGFRFPEYLKPIVASGFLLPLLELRSQKRIYKASISKPEETPSFMNSFLHMDIYDLKEK